MRSFNALEAVVHLARIAIEVEIETHHALTRAAKIVEAEAKAEIGHYQDAVGPFAGWAELADRTKADRLNAGYPENEPLLRTGELRDSIGHKVEGHEAAVGSDLAVAEWQELGTSRIPPRSFLGGAAVRKTPEVVEVIGEGAVIGLAGHGVVGRFLRVK